MKDIYTEQEKDFCKSIEKQIIEFAKDRIPKEYKKQMDNFIYIQAIMINTNRIMDKIVKDFKYNTR
jgi:hypothetical protein